MITFYTNFLSIYWKYLCKALFLDYAQCDHLINYTWHVYICPVELAWRGSGVLDCHATARGSIPGVNGVFTELYVLRLIGVPSLNDLAVDKTTSFIDPLLANINRRFVHAVAQKHVSLTSR